MKYSQFMSAIVSHYGQYLNKFSENVVLKYIMVKFAEEDLEDVFQQLVLNHSNKYRTDTKGCPPDPKVLEDIFSSDDSTEIKAMEAWQMLKNISASSTVFFEDIVVQAVIEYGWRSWPEFANERDHQEKSYWCRKNFIELYQKFSKRLPAITAKKLLGTTDRMNRDGLGVGYYGLKLIGNIENCKRLLSDADADVSGIAQEIAKYVDNVLEVV